jgi:drug/metabolite transporter (DMT)-like permease
MRPVSIAAFCYLMIGIPAGLFLCTTDIVLRVQHNPHGWFSLGAILLLSAMGTALAQALYNRLIKEVGGLMASIVTYLMPIVSLAWGLADHEPIGWMHIISMLTILAGVYLVSQNRPVKPPVAES